MSGLGIIAATPRDRSLAGQPSRAAVHASNVAVLRMAALMAGGTLLAAAATIWNLSGSFPNPWQQELAALVTLVLGLIVVAGTVVLSESNRYVALSLFGTCTLLVVALPLVRYIPVVYTTVYEQDLEALFPPLWPYSISIPLLLTLVGELTFAHRERTAPIFLNVVSLVPATTLLFFGSMMIGKMAGTMTFVATPQMTILALGTCILISGLIILGTVAATRGLVWIGVSLLLGIGLFLEIGSIFFYEGFSRHWLAVLTKNRFSSWLPFAAGTVPGAMTLATSVLLLRANVSRRSLSYG